MVTISYRQQIRTPSPPVASMFMTRPLALISILLAAAPACGLLSSKHSTRSAAEINSQRVGVEVTSHNWSDITVYLIAGGLPQRLGMVTALSTATFDFPSHRTYTSAGVRLRALPVAGRAFTSETILVQPGQVITWTLESDLDRSSVTVY